VFRSGGFENCELSSGTMIRPAANSCRSQPIHDRGAGKQICPRSSLRSVEISARSAFGAQRGQMMGIVEALEQKKRNLITQKLHHDLGFYSRLKDPIPRNSALDFSRIRDRFRRNESRIRPITRHPHEASPSAIFGLAREARGATVASYRRAHKCCSELADTCNAVLYSSFTL